MKFDYRRVEVFVGVDMAKENHYAQAVTATGEEVFHRPVLNDQAAIEKLIIDARRKGRVALVIDMPSSAAQLLLTVARDLEVPVAYVTGLQMRRAADLYAGAAKTDPRDAWVLADFARRHVDQLAWIEVTDDLLAKLRILNGRDVDLAEDANRASNRCRDALLSISPSLERVLGSHSRSVEYAISSPHAQRRRLSPGSATTGSASCFIRVRHALRDGSRPPSAKPSPRNRSRSQVNKRGVRSLSGSSLISNGSLINAAYSASRSSRCSCRTLSERSW
jgi:hypothetical protein